MLSIIVAIAENNVIGANNTLIWHISADLKRFKSLTTGHAVIMGRRTFESLPKRPLPNRRNIVLTHNADYRPEGAEVAHSVAEVLDLVASDEEAFVIGGEQVYELFLPYASKLYVTKVHATFAGDAYFPPIPATKFAVASTSEQFQDEKSNLAYTFIDYQRV